MSRKTGGTQTRKRKYHTLTGHEGSILAFYAWNDTYVSGSEDSSIKVHYMWYVLHLVVGLEILQTSGHFTRTPRLCFVFNSLW